MAQQQGFWQREMENGRDRAQARRIAEAGIDWARAVLADDAFVSPGVDNAKEMWAMQLPRFRWKAAKYKAPSSTSKDCSI